MAKLKKVAMPYLYLMNSIHGTDWLKNSKDEAIKEAYKHFNEKTEEELNTKFYSLEKSNRELVYLFNKKYHDFKLVAKYEPAIFNPNTGVYSAAIRIRLKKELTKSFKNEDVYFDEKYFNDMMNSMKKYMKNKDWMNMGSVIIRLEKSLYYTTCDSILNETIATYGFKPVYLEIDPDEIKKNIKEEKAKLLKQMDAERQAALKK